MRRRVRSSRTPSPGSAICRVGMMDGIDGRQHCVYSIRPCPGENEEGEEEDHCAGECRACSRGGVFGPTIGPSLLQESLDLSGRKGGELRCSSPCG